MLKLYHKNVYMPVELKYKLANVKVDLTWSNHAIHAAQDDRYGQIKLASKIEFTFDDIIEVETKNNQLNKIVVRVSYDKERDVIYALAQGGVVKTVWINLKGDTHNSLDVSKYETIKQEII